MIKVGDVPAKRVLVHLYTQMRNDTVLEWDADQNTIETFKGKLKDRLKTFSQHMSKRRKLIVVLTRNYCNGINKLETDKV